MNSSPDSILQMISDHCVKVLFLFYAHEKKMAKKQKVDSH